VIPPRRATRCIQGLILAHILVVTWVGIAYAASIASWTGEVVAVTDGDTIKVMRDGEAVKIRLAEIVALRNGSRSEGRLNSLRRICVLERLSP
jgi:hypothetical protein